MSLEYLTQLTRQAGFDLPPKRLAALWRYETDLLEKNQVMNLTAIRDADEAARLHVVDALELTRVHGLNGKRLLDVGTGGGIPGVILKLAEPTMKLTLLDATAKKIDWLRELLTGYGIEADYLTGRAEELAATHRAKYDVVTARAVTRLSALCELCLPYVKQGGLFLAMKGPEASEELEQARKAIRTLGGQPLPVHTYTLPTTETGGGEQRAIILIRKTAPTPPQYPRRWSRIKEHPL